jgi:hypothetical protein
MRNFGMILMLILLGIFHAGCQKEDPGATDQDMDLVTREGVILKNNMVVLNQRVEIKNELVKMIPEYAAELKADPADQKSTTGNFSFRLSADVEAPRLNGQTLMATHVAIRDHYAIVSYNIRGDRFGGAVDVFNVADPSNPFIVSQALFPWADINTVDFRDDKIFVAGAAGNYIKKRFSTPAFLAVLSVNDQMVIQSVDTLIDIVSYSANGLKVTDTHVFVTSGDQGGITILDQKLKKSVNLIRDARSVAEDGTHLYVLSGQPGKISAINKNTGALISSFATGGVGIPLSKTEISTDDRNIYAALNDDGVKIFLKDGTLKQHISKPETPLGGKDYDYVTNSAVIDKNLLLMANGRAGIAVAEVIPQRNDEAVMLGKMVFEDMHSSNYVSSSNNIIFVASGLGGLKILTISKDDGVPDDIIPTEPCATLMQAIAGFLPPMQNAMVLRPQLFDPANNLQVVTKEETPVYVVFIHEVASWKNSFGYYAYPADNPPQNVEELQKHIVFPNVSLVNEGGGLKPGDMVQLGDKSFAANTVIGFFLVAQGWANGQMVEGVYTHYTDKGFNIDQNQQHVLFIETTCNDLVLAFEDIKVNSSDKDFNDIILVVKDNPDQLMNSRIKTEGIVKVEVK